VQALDGSALTPFQAASLIWTSPEHRALQVDLLYRAFLRRADSPQEQALWANALLTGALRESDVVLLFLTSPEYQASHPTNQGYVLGLYDDLLQRNGNVSAAEVAEWQGPLDQGALSRAQVAAAFLSSSEAVDVAVTGLYLTFLHRHESAAELQLWSGALSSGQVGGNTAVAQFLSCPEYTGF
jgi:hypothetical protein